MQPISNKSSLTSKHAHNLKGRLSTPVAKRQILKTSFLKIELNADVEKITKTTPSERTCFCRYFELPNTKIGLETIEISYINDYIAKNVVFLEIVENLTWERPQKEHHENGPI